MARHYLRTLLPLLLAAGSCLAPHAAAAEEPPVFLVRKADGAGPRGALRELKAGWTLRVGDDKALSANEVLSVRGVAHQLPAFPAGRQVLLANGDRLPAEAPRLAGEKLFFRHPDLAGGKETGVPLSAVSVLWFAAPDNAGPPDRLRRRLATAARPRDRVLLRNGDVVEGLVNALDAKRVEVEVEKKPLEVALDKVAAVAFGTDLADKARPKGVYGRVVLAGDGEARGTRLSLSAATCDGATLRGTTVFGAAVRVELKRVAALDLFQGAAVYLSDLTPARYEFTPYLGDGGVRWPLVADGAVTGRDLRLGGATYDKGLGMHSRSRATYTLAGGYRRFEALVGLDDVSGRAGSVRVRVLADGKPLDLGAEGEITAKGGPLAVGVSVAGVKELALEVDFGRGGDVQDHVDWADARLVK